jgi:hypothetical protein
MSYDLNAYLRKDRLPSMSALGERLEAAGGRVVLQGVTDLTSVSGFLPVVLDGAPTGFEIYSDEINEAQRSSYRKLLERKGEAPDRFLEILTACDLDIGFSCKASDSREMTAARIVAKVLAEAAQGWFSDPQTSETIRYAPR